MTCPVSGTMQFMGEDDDLPRTADGHVDFAALLADVTFDDLIRDGAVPFWSVATRPADEDPEGNESPDDDALRRP